MPELEPESKIQYIVRDKPAEKGLTINNILLAVLILGGTAFSTVLINNMNDIKDRLTEALSAIVDIKIHDARVANDISHVVLAVGECQKFHKEVEKRLDKLESNFKRNK